jgi:cytochrome b pre-mRNA-processing protein 3
MAKILIKIFGKIANFLLGEPTPIFLPQANGWYEALGNMGRNRAFYTNFAVPDTLNARYDMLCLILCCMHTRLQNLGETQLNQALFDIAFAHLEQQLRQAGVGDLAVPRQMKKLIQAFYGRLEAYNAALEAADQTAFAAVVARNVFAGVDNADDKACALVACVWPWWQQLQAWHVAQDLPTFV